MEKSKSKRSNFEIKHLGDFEMPEELDAKIQQMTAIAESELEATRVNFRWHKEPLSLVKQVAAAMGVPYQTYMKQVLYKQALNDMEHITAFSRLGLIQSHLPEPTLSPLISSDPKRQRV